MRNPFEYAVVTPNLAYVYAITIYVTTRNKFSTKP